MVKYLDIKLETKNIQKINVDTVNELNAYNKHKVLKKYHQWLKQKREQERKKIKKERDLRWKMKNRYSDGNTCTDCDKVICNDSIRCRSCHAKYMRKMRGNNENGNQD